MLEKGRRCRKEGHTGMRRIFKISTPVVEKTETGELRAFQPRAQTGNVARNHEKRLALVARGWDEVADKSAQF
jgi:hypothetical protein